jgi:hypothetical protein
MEQIRSLDLVDSLFAEMDRVRGIIKVYETPELNGAGRFAASMMKQEIHLAEQAIKYVDTVSMIRLYQSLKEYKL